MIEKSGARNLFVLTIGMAAAFSGAPLVALTGGLIGSDLSPSAALATLPIGTFVVGMAAASFPAAMVMRRMGRRRGFALGAAIAALACGLAVEAISSADFALFCIATLLIGGNLAFVQQYRFAAVESVAERHAPRAVSIVLTAGIVSGILGPELAWQTRDWLGTPFGASFIVLGALYVAVTLLMLLGLRDTPAAITPSVPGGDGLRAIVARPAFRLALVSGMVA
jgi:MFS family permease